MTDAAPFYDRLAPYYHLLYGDWETSVARQGAALARLLDSHATGNAARGILISAAVELLLAIGFARVVFKDRRAAPSV